MKNINKFIHEKLKVTGNERHVELNGLSLEEIASRIADLLYEDDFANGSGGHCTGFEAVRDCGLYDVITYHCMEEDVAVRLSMDDDEDAVMDFISEYEAELTELILEYE